MAYHSGGVGVENLAVRLPPHFFLTVRYVGQIRWYSLFEHPFEIFVELLTIV